MTVVMAVILATASRGQTCAPGRITPNTAIHAPNKLCYNYDKAGNRIAQTDRNSNPKDPTSQYLAKNWGPYLLEKGFGTINGDGYSPIKGDIRVWEAYPGQKSNAGHIDMYNGHQWLSDFRQNDPIWPGKNYRINQTPFQIFRWGTYP